MKPPSPAGLADYWPPGFSPVQSLEIQGGGLTPCKSPTGLTLGCLLLQLVRTSLTCLHWCPSALSALPAHVPPTTLECVIIKYKRTTRNHWMCKGSL